MEGRQIRSIMIAIVVLSALVHICGCKVNTISVNQEKDLGGRAARDIESKVEIETGQRAQLVSRIGQSLAAAADSNDYTFSYKVIRDRNVNAFAIPGGYVYIFSGMLDRLENSDQLAAVLAHETIHVVHRHFATQYRRTSNRQLALAVLLGLTKAGQTAQTIAQIGEIAISNDYSRQQETDADLSGMELMKRAGYNPHGMVEMLRVLQRVAGDQPRLFAWTSDHPQISVRIRKAEQREAELR